MADQIPGAPQFIGRYKLIERIGKGAMGMVYAAVDESMGRRVAVKVMMADLEQEPETRERFYREAKVTGQLVHRNIVTVFDLGEEHERPYIVMELLQGAPLGDHLQQHERLTLDAKLDLMMQVCEGLRVAHERGVIHRDIKPNNLFVLPDGTLKILDFGIARLATSTLTASGFLVGTPEYMSPEQAMGGPIDARSDVFSAAGVFYFILTGRPAFGTSDLPRVLNAVMSSPPAPLAERDAPDALRRILVKALEKDPDRRYGSAAEMLAAIDKVRRVREGERHRLVEAALDRYRRILALIATRRALAKSLRVPDADRMFDDTLARLAQRFPDFARFAAAATQVPPIDRDVAAAALSVLQARHTVELAALDALREEAGDSMRRAPAAAFDLTLHRGSVTEAGDDEAGERAGARRGALQPSAIRQGPWEGIGVSHTLIVNDGTRQRELPLVGTLVIGRDPTCDISETDPLLSRRHVEFVADAGQVVVRDLASRNGILINGAKLTQGILHHGDVIQVGSLQVTFVEDSGPLPRPRDPELDADRTTMVPPPAARGAEAPLSSDSPTFAIPAHVSNAPTVHPAAHARPTTVGSEPSAGPSVSSVAHSGRATEPADPPRPDPIGVEIAARIVATAQYQVTEASAGCADLVGVGPDSLIGQYLIDAIPDQDVADGVLFALSALGASGEQFFLVAPGTRGYGVSIVVSREGKG